MRSTKKSWYFISRCLTCTPPSYSIAKRLIHFVRKSSALNRTRMADRATAFIAGDSQIPRGDAATKDGGQTSLLPAGAPHSKSLGGVPPPCRRLPPWPSDRAGCPSPSFFPPEFRSPHPFPLTPVRPRSRNTQREGRRPWLRSQRPGTDR